MRSPVSPLYLFLFLFSLSLLIAVVQLGLVRLTFHKLGLSDTSAFLLLFSSLFGSLINLPLSSIDSEPRPIFPEARLYGLLRPPQIPFRGKTIIAINVGGCVIPVLFSLSLLIHGPLNLIQVILATIIVTIVSRLLSRPIAGVGIGMPILVAPIAAALVAILVGGEHSAPLAYISGTLGVLIGADLLRLRDVRMIGAPLASIGGAGTFDGIFITGIIAVLLT